MLYGFSLWHQRWIYVLCSTHFVYLQKICQKIIVGIILHLNVSLGKTNTKWMGICTRTNSFTSVDINKQPNTPFLANYLPTGHSELNVCLIFETQHHIFPQIQQTQWVILGTLKQISLEISNLFGIAPDFSVLISWSYPSQASAIIFWIKGFLIGTFASSCRRICSLHGTFPFKFLVMEYYKRIQHPRSLEDFLCGSCI